MNLKKVYFFIIAIAIIGFGCKKQDTIPQTTTGDPTAAKIEQFLNAVESHNKSGTEMTTTDAIWNVEAALNYAYCDVSIPSVNSYVDTINFQIPVNNDMVNWNDVVNLYDYCLQEINTFASTFDFPYHFIVVDLENKGIENNQMTIKLMVSLGENDIKRGNLSDRSLWYFGPTDYWRWGNSEGKCNGYTDPNNWDAAQLIMGRINPTLIREVGTYFTYVEQRTQICSKFYPLCGDCNNDNYCDYKMFQNRVEFPNFDLCLDPTEMNFHLDGTNAVMYTYEANGGPRPAGKNPIHIDQMFGTYYFNQQPLEQIYMHMMSVSYGIEHISRY